MFKKFFLLSILTFSFCAPQEVKASNCWTSPVVVGLEVLLFGAGVGASVFCYKKAKSYNKKLLFLKELAEGLGVDGVENLTKDLVLSDDAKKFSKGRNQLELFNEVIKSIKDYDSVESFSEKISKKKLFGRLGMGGGVLLSVIGILGFIKSLVEIKKEKSLVVNELKKFQKFCEVRKKLKKLGIDTDHKDFNCIKKNLEEIEKEEVFLLADKVSAIENKKEFEAKMRRGESQRKAGVIEEARMELKMAVDAIERCEEQLALVGVAKILLNEINSDIDFYQGEFQKRTLKN